jgi:hypothetical protein
LGELRKRGLQRFSSEYRVRPRPDGENDRRDFAIQSPFRRQMHLVVACPILIKYGYLRHMLRFPGPPHFVERRLDDRQRMAQRPQ